MTVSDRKASAGADAGRNLVIATGQEFKRARSASGLSQLVVASAAGMSRPQYGRIERGLVPDLSIRRAALIASVLGLEPSVRFFPHGDPVRDQAHAALLERLHACCHKALRWRTEVPLPSPGDPRAWDALIRGVHPATGDQWRVGVEAETRPNDLQALDRKLALKERDGGVDWSVLLLLASRHNRSLLAQHGAAMRGRFPLDGRRALELLAAGAPLGANAIIVL